MGILSSLGRGFSDIRFIFSVIGGLIFIAIGVVFIVTKPTSLPGGPGFPPNQSPPKNAKQRKLMGVFLIVLGVLIPVISYVWMRLVHKSKGLATVAGGMDIFSMLLGR